MQLQCKLSVMKVEVGTLISMHDKREYDENAVRKRQMLGSLHVLYQVWFKVICSVPR